MRLDLLGDRLADALAKAMRAHERSKAVQKHCRTIGAGRATRLAMEVRALTRETKEQVEEAIIEYCRKEGLGLKQFEAEVERRKLA